MRRNVDPANVVIGAVMGGLFGVMAGVIEFSPWARGFWLTVAALALLGGGLGALPGRRNL